MAISRSENMSRIKGRDTKPELVLRAALEAAGLSFAEGLRTPVGKPDLILATPPTAIFVNGCFWHGCPDHYSRPGTREEFWSAKLRENVERDRRQTLALAAAGWGVLHLWEHEVYADLDVVVLRVLQAARGVLREPEPMWRVIRVELLDAELRLERRYLEELRDPERGRTVEGRRVTKKGKVAKKGG